MRILHDACDATNGRTPITVEFPAERLIFDVTIRDPDELTAAVVGFTRYAVAIAKAAKEMHDRLAPRDTVTVVIDDEGFTLTWHDAIEKRERRQSYTADGKPR